MRDVIALGLVAHHAGVHAGVAGGLRRAVLAVMQVLAAMLVFPVTQVFPVMQVFAVMLALAVMPGAACRAVAGVADGGTSAVPRALSSPLAAAHRPCDSQSRRSTTDQREPEEKRVPIHASHALTQISFLPVGRDRLPEFIGNP